jgi:Ser/Thr protein kinase RdoA (MazF antagonist)
MAGMGGETTDTERQRLERAARLARAALGLYGLADARLEPLRDGHVQVFRVSSASRGEHVLRLYAAPAREPSDAARDPRLRVGAALRSPGVLRSQLAWLSALRRDAGLLVPEPVPTLGGEPVGDVRVGGTPWARMSVLVGWVPGEHKREDLGEGDARELGSFVARMHAHAERWTPPEGSEFPRWDWRWPFGGSAPIWSEGPRVYSDEEMGVFKEAARRVRGRLEELGEGGEVFGPIHRDLGLGNIVFSRAGVGALDFDLCGLGHYLLDLSALRMDLGRLPEGRGAPAWDAVLEGYGRERPLPWPRARLERHLDAFQVMRRVSAVNRQLELLDSEAAGQGARGPRFLRTSLTWLGRRVPHLAALPTLPLALCQLMAS